jgi:hypothetical protein
MEQNPENMMNPMAMDIQSCPVPTQDPGIRAANTDQAVQLANYGAAFGGQPACGKCIFFDISSRMKNCMDEKDPSIGYCHRWQFQCNKKNTCDAWDEGGPIRSEKRSLQMQSEKQEDAMRPGPHVPKEEIMSSITPVQEEQLPAETMGAQEYVAAARGGGQVSNIIKKKRLGGTKKANRGTGITYDEAWSSNKDDVQSKYETQGDFEVAAEEWWANQENNNSENPENTNNPNTDEKGAVQCNQCSDGSPISQMFQDKCPDGWTEYKEGVNPCDAVKDEKKEEEKKPEDVDVKAKQQGKPSWMSPDPYHLPFMDDTNLGKAIGAIHGTLYDFGLVGNDKTKEVENVKEADKLEEKAEDDGRVSCQKCEGGYPISNLFKGACPEGWLPASDTNPCDAGTDPKTEEKDADKDSTKESSFDEAFRKARDAGQDEFTWNGKRYHTMTREEVDAKNKQNLDALKEGIQPPQSQSEIDIQNERDRILSGDDKWWNTTNQDDLQNQYYEMDGRSTMGAKLGYEYKHGGLYDFIKQAAQGTEQKDAESWYQGYLHNIGQEEPLSFEQWKQDKLPFMDTSGVANPQVTPMDNSQIDLNVPQTNNTDFSIMGEDADGDGIPNSIDSDFAGTTPAIGPENQPEMPSVEEGIVSCQKCDGGFPINVAAVDGKCPEGSSKDDGTNPCDKENQTVDANAETEKKKEDDDCPPTYKKDPETGNCVPGRNFMRPFVKVPKVITSIARDLREKREEKKRQSVTTKSDVVFADVTGEDYQGDTDVNTGKKVGRNVYSRQGAYGTEVDKFIPTRGGQANIDMETYKKLIKAGAKLDIID